MSADEALAHGWIKEPGPEVLVLVCSSFQRVLDAQDRERIPSESRVDRSVVDALRPRTPAGRGQSGDGLCYFCMCIFHVW